MPDTCWLRPRLTVSSPISRSGQDAGDHGREHPQPEVAAEIGRRKTGHGRQHHDALDAQVEHPGTLGKQLPDGAEGQRGGDADQGRKKTDLEDLGQDFIHWKPSAAATRYWLNIRAISMVTRAVP